MSFLVYQKQSPDFRYISIMFHSNTNIENISVEDFKNISIMDISINDMNNVKSPTIVDFIFFASNILNNYPKTTNRKLASIKRLFEYLYTNILISSNPSKGIESASIEKRIPKYLTLDESNAI